MGTTVGWSDAFTLGVSRICELRSEDASREHQPQLHALGGPHRRQSISMPVTFVMSSTLQRDRSATNLLLPTLVTHTLPPPGRLLLPDSFFTASPLPVLPTKILLISFRGFILNAAKHERNDLVWAAQAHRGGWEAGAETTSQNGRRRDMRLRERKTRQSLADPGDSLTDSICCMDKKGDTTSLGRG